MEVIADEQSHTSNWRFAERPWSSDVGAAGVLLRTLMVCFTVWLIATEILIFDQIKFDAKAELEQAARALP